MKIILKEELINVIRDDGCLVDYYIFPEYEIHYNEIKPGIVQKWHRHLRIWETLFVIEGEIEIRWKNDKGEEEREIVSRGGVIEVENTSHTLANIGLETVKLLVFRFIPTGGDKREIIKNDKVLDE